MSRKKERPTFASEAELCATFSAEMVSQGWQVYAETDGWDVLLVGHGLQVGVEAKLAPSIEVLAQVARRIWDEEAGPDHAVLLVGPRPPRRSHSNRPRSEAFADLARYLHAAVVRPHWQDGWMEHPGAWVWPELVGAVLMYAPALHFTVPAWVPEVAPGTVAGTPSPVRLTAWKYAALQLCARLELRGYVTVADFRELGLHTSRWYHFWLIPSGSDKPQRWVRKPGKLLADAQHPAAFATMMERERSLLEAKPPEPVQIELQPLPLFDVVERDERHAQ